MIGIDHLCKTAIQLMQII